MSISRGKTNLLVVREQQPGEQPLITLKGQALDKVEAFPYLGSEVQKDSKMEKEVTVRLQKVGTIYQIWRRKVFRSHILSKDTKLRAFRTLVMPVLLYGAETWNLSKCDQESSRHST